MRKEVSVALKVRWMGMAPRARSMGMALKFRRYLMIRWDLVNMM